MITVRCLMNISKGLHYKMAKKFDVGAIAQSVNTEKIKSGKTEVFLKNFSGNGNGAVISVPLDRIDDFPNHPFRVIDDEEMQKLVESIKEVGVLTPVNLKSQENGRYFCIAGHRRRRASLLAGKAEIPAIISDMTDDEAIIAMVDTNLQREKILPSEKARAYKMKLDAMKRQGKRTDLTSSQLETKLRADEEIANNAGESRAQVQRYIRLTHLAPKLLDMVDNDKMPLTVGAELSYLSTEEQLALLDVAKKAPTLTQATELKKISKESMLTAETIKRTLYPPKETEDEFSIEQLTIDEVDEPEVKKSSKDVLSELKKKYAPESIPNWTGNENTVMKGYILKACSLWNSENTDELIPKEIIDNLMTALGWAMSDLTAQEAYEYYMKH